MKRDKNGRIAYHVILLHEDRPSTIVQYDFDGSIESEVPLNQLNLNNAYQLTKNDDE